MSYHQNKAIPLLRGDKATDLPTGHRLENPYLQWFIGLPYYSYEPPFDASTMVSFQKRITPEMIELVNEAIIRGAVEK
ncbi:MAG: transposase [Synergistaceae bacterium]|nr:transposase [Synergistaceae bacterium]